METLLFYFGKVMVSSAVLFSYYHLFLRDKTFHHYNRFYLLSAVLLSLLLPLLKVSYFTIELNENFYLLMTKFQNFQNIKNTNNDNLYFTIAYAVFGLVTLFFLVKLAIGILKIEQFKKQFPKEKIEGIAFYQTDLDDAPFSYFKNLFWKNSIILQSDLGCQILKHEMVHIEQKHSFDKIFIEIIAGIFWFNPVFWFIKKEINLIHEYLADKKAVKHSDTKAFVQMLLANHFSGHVITGTSPFLSSNLKKRLKMLQKPTTKYGYLRRTLALPLVFMIAFVYAVNVKNEEIEKTNKIIEQKVSKIKKDTLKETAYAYLIEDNNPKFDSEEKLKNATNKSLFMIDGEEVSKEVFIKFKNSRENLIFSYTDSEMNKELTKEFGVIGPYGEYEKYGVFQIDTPEKIGKTAKKYWKIQDKYAPEWRQYLKSLKDPKNKARLEKIRTKQSQEFQQKRETVKNRYVATSEFRVTSGNHPMLVNFQRGSESDSYIFEGKKISKTEFLEIFDKYNQNKHYVWSFFEDHLAKGTKTYSGFKTNDDKIKEILKEDFGNSKSIKKLSNVKPIKSDAYQKELEKDLKLLYKINDSIKKNKDTNVNVNEIKLNKKFSNGESYEIKINPNENERSSSSIPLIIGVEAYSNSEKATNNIQDPKFKEIFLNEKKREPIVDYQKRNSRIMKFPNGNEMKIFDDSDSNQVYIKTKGKINFGNVNNSKISKYYVNGKLYNKAEIEKINLEKIATININKSNDGSENEIRITTK